MYFWEAFPEVLLWRQKCMVTHWKLLKAHNIHCGTGDRARSASWQEAKTRAGKVKVYQYKLYKKIYIQRSRASFGMARYRKLALTFTEGSHRFCQWLVKIRFEGLVGPRKYVPFGLHYDGLHSCFMRLSAVLIRTDSLYIIRRIPQIFLYLKQPSYWRWYQLFRT